MVFEEPAMSFQVPRMSLEVPMGAFGVFRVYR